jgi:hypothetical protein
MEALFSTSRFFQVNNLAAAGFDQRPGRNGENAVGMARCGRATKGSSPATKTKLLTICPILQSIASAAS